MKQILKRWLASFTAPDRPRVILAPWWPEDSPEFEAKLNELADREAFDEDCADEAIGDFNLDTADPNFRKAVPDPANERRAFLKVVMKRTVWDRNRRKSTRDKYHDNSGDSEDFKSCTDDPLTSAIFQEYKDLIIAALKQLPVKERAVLYLYYFLDNTCDQIAKRHKLATGTVQVRLWRGRDKLLAILVNLRGRR